ncbi:hypothetical protein EMIHUDRAFT_223738 [Emiliania huxleyi CCMP1516]|uniref:RecA family profile 1 domain-containing protein n=2 Tax=Emiliania huxleyi TaxID=2903 RepID=A0A0D3KU03_EMIH1|nr:hypothetical protein EMIHUDRAFT_223738 [Emiliania huxleyi CCMP1516]EOD39238.1 hypothetical protein EMIHUDRAFT_223738 [Emiliania huxleyi CCMP1516]|eukprot:XP_005791667.1 hypothetical protein EMIHUDRAFT_223738 [Emiliania huxleyi CCMP1516]
MDLAVCSEDRSGLLSRLGRQPLAQLASLPSGSPAAGATAEGCLLLRDDAHTSAEYADECRRYRLGVASTLFAQAALNAAEAVEQACRRGALLSTGMAPLDEALGGGLQTGEVVELVGASGSGKSQACMAIGARQLAASDWHVLYIDTALSFTAERMLQLRRLRERLRVVSEAQDVLGACSARLLCVLESLVAELSSCTDGGSWYRRLKLLIVDSAFAPLLSEAAEDSRSLAGAQLARLQLLLRQLAARWQLSVLVTNAAPAGSNERARLVSWLTVRRKSHAARHHADPSRGTPPPALSLRLCRATHRLSVAAG